jgi:hypothetical protein
VCIEAGSGVCWKQKESRRGRRSDWHSRHLLLTQRPGRPATLHIRKSGQAPRKATREGFVASKAQGTRHKAQSTKQQAAGRVEQTRRVSCNCVRKTPSDASRVLVLVVAITREAKCHPLKSHRYTATDWGSIQTLLLQRSAPRRTRPTLAADDLPTSRLSTHDTAAAQTGTITGHFHFRFALVSLSRNSAPALFAPSASCINVQLALGRLPANHSPPSAR